MISFSTRPLLLGHVVPHISSCDLRDYRSVSASKSDVTEAKFRAFGIAIGPNESDDSQSDGDNGIS